MTPANHRVTTCIECLMKTTKQHMLQMCFPPGKAHKHWLTRVAIYRVFKTANPDCVTQTYFHTQQLNIHHSYATTVLCFDLGL